MRKLETLTPEERAEAEVQLGIMADSQNKLWDASLVLEKLFGVEIDTTNDFDGLDLKDVLELARDITDEEGSDA